MPLMLTVSPVGVRRAASRNAGGGLGPSPRPVAATKSYLGT